MTECIISLSPTMQNRIDFEHELLDEVGIYKLEPEQLAPVVERYAQTRDQDDAFILNHAYMWLVKDLVCRFRAHWPQTHCMTDDMVSVGLAALSEFVQKDFEARTESQFFTEMQSFVYERMRAYINDNRSMFSASLKTNKRRQSDDRPLEYHFAGQLNDEITGSECTDTFIVDVLDSIEALNEADAEELRDRVMDYLHDNHGITEDSLSLRERQALDELIHNLRN